MEKDPKEQAPAKAGQESDAEAQRIEALRRYGILDTPPDEAFDDLTRLASHICKTPISLINLVDEQRIWSKSNVGMLATQVPRDLSFDEHAIANPDELLVVEDTSKDSEFSDNPLVNSDPKIKFYAAAPLVTPEGHVIGTLCVMDRKTRTLSADQAAALWALSRQAMARLELRRNVTELQQSIEEQQMTTEALQEAEAKFRSLVETVPAVVYMDSLDAVSSNIYISPQVTELLGYTPEEWREDPDMWPKVLHPDDSDKAMADVESLQPREKWALEYRMIAKDGRVVWVHDEAVIVVDEVGRPLCWQGVWLDITERKQAEQDLRRAVEELRRLDEVKNTLLHAVSHDLRSPITSMLGSAVTLEREEANLSPNERRGLVRGLASSARKMHRLVNDLLDMDRIEKGIVTPKRHMTDVGALVRRVVEELGFMTDRPIEVDTEEVRVAVDGPKVERIVENLLANTSKHTPSGTQVWVRVQPADEGVRIAVEDSGRGVPRELWDTIFEPFKQGDSSGERPGVGIGLSLVARFAELHGGRAWVEDREGGGASFKVYLPDGPPEDESPEQPVIFESPPLTNQPTAGKDGE
ncbi:MAG: ATP-binding protein [Actinomycetota bacterium]